MVAAVREARASGKTDLSIATLVRQLKLVERLDDAVIEQLETEGTGRELLDALDRQRELTRGLKTPALSPLPLDAGAAPTPEEQSAIIREARENALGYTKNLPDFLCTQTMTRYSAAAAAADWKRNDTLEISVRYTAKGEEYKLQKIDGKATTKTFEKIGGFSSDGEFGSMLRSIFRPGAAADFHWKRRTVLRGKPAHVFAFEISASHSTYKMNWGTLLKRSRLTAGVRGFVFVDIEKKQVLRIVAEAAEIPDSFPIRRTYGSIDYAYVSIAGQSFLLPQRAETDIYFKNAQRRNVSGFGDYRKFSGDASISFEAEK